jgi:peptidoglycan/xylan/chitin deacetylase (PgdA/CDA1 family)
MTFRGKGFVMALRAHAHRLGPLLVGAAWLWIWLLRLSRRRLGLIVVYHAVAAERGDTGRSFSAAVGIRLFRAQLRHYRRWYRLTALEDLSDAVAGRGRGGRFPLALTFDDDLRSHVDTVLPAIRAISAPATFFLGADPTSRAIAYWWDPLEAALDRGLPLPPPIASLVTTDRRAIARAVINLDPHERDGMTAELRKQVGLDVNAPGLDERDVAVLAPVATIGFHTRGHHLLTRLGDDELARELTVGLSTLRHASKQTVLAIAYPHGEADERVANAAREAGFQIGVTTRPTAVTPGTDPLLLGRVEASVSSLGDHVLRLVRVLASTDSSKIERL